MKKRVYILLFMGVLLLSGCNIFSGLDKEDLSAPGAFEFKLDDAMAEGDYTVVVGMIDDKIAASPELTAINNGEIADAFTSLTAITSATAIADIQAIYEEITTYLDANISNPVVQEYIELKLTLAEAQLGMSGLKMTDIIAKVPTGTSPNMSGPRNISKVISPSSSDIKITDLIPNDLNQAYLENAINAYMASLPTSSGTAFNVLIDDNAVSYLNAALATAISALNRFIEVYKDDRFDDLTLVTSSAIADLEDEWAAEVGRARLELKLAFSYITLYGTNSGLMEAEDLADLEEDFDDLLNRMEGFTNETDYIEFASAAGITIATDSAM